MKDLTGQRFGKWTVIKFDHRKGKSYYWLCRCECGEEKIVRSDGLINGRSKSCGCSKESVELTQGKRFGSLVLIRKTNELYKDGSYLYECKCDCGNTIKTTSSRLKNGHIQSCGCGRYQIDDLTGKKFNYLTVTGFSHSDG